MRFVLEMNLDGALFDGQKCGLEVARLLRQVATEVRGLGRVGLHEQSGSIADDHGTSIGSWEVQYNKKHRPERPPSLMEAIEVPVLRNYEQTLEGVCGTVRLTDVATEDLASGNFILAPAVAFVKGRRTLVCLGLVPK